MLAEKYLERRFNEGKAEGKAEVLLDIRRAAERGNLTQEDVERILRGCFQSIRLVLYFGHDTQTISQRPDR